MHESSRSLGHVMRYAGGVSWQDISAGLDFGTVWDLEWHDGALWACGRTNGGDSLVARWDGASWQQWTGPVNGLGGSAATSLAVVQDELYVGIYGGGLWRLNGASWVRVSQASPIARMQGDDCGRGEPVLFMGSDAWDDFWSYDPSGAMRCGATCPTIPAGDAACPAGCFGGSCVHSMALHDDGSGPVAYGGAYHGAMYRWDAATRRFVVYPRIPDDGHVQALASFRGMLYAGTSASSLFSMAGVTAWHGVRTFSPEEPVSALAVDPDDDVLWIGHGGVPFAFARSYGDSMVRTWDGTTLTDRGVVGGFDAGVTALLVVGSGGTAACDAGLPQVVDCAGAVTAVQLHGSGLAGSDCGVAGPVLAWRGGFVEGVAHGSSPIVHFAGPGAYTVTLVAAGSGSSATCTTVVTVRDVDPPTITELPSITIDCDDPVPPAGASAVDSCDAVPTLVLDESIVGGPCPQARTIVRTWTATDAGGNTSTLTRSIAVVDVDPPVLAGLPADVETACPVVPPAPLVAATDACDPDVPVLFAEQHVDGPCPGTYALRRTWNAVDDCGNAVQAIRFVQVVDDIAPALSGVPADARVACNAVPAPASPLASDDCDAAPSIAFAERREDGPCPHSYRLVRTWTATDACRNASTASQVLDVVDDVAPALSGIPSDARVACDAVPAPASPLASDDCDASPSIAFAERREDGPCPHSYRLVRTWTATDACRNASTASQVLDVVDDQPPRLIGVPADVVVECPDVPPVALVTAADGCDGAPATALAERREDGRCPGDYRLLRTWTATDACGNAASATQVVRVTDTTPPDVTPGGSDAHSLWPPNHRMVTFGRDAFAVEAADACSGPVTWRYAGCASDQPDDGLGDGDTSGDCVVAGDGSSFAVRAERQGGVPPGRRYAVSVVATDACGNASSPTLVGYVHVPHDRRGGAPGR